MQRKTLSLEGPLVVQIIKDLNGHPPIKMKPNPIHLQNKPVIVKALDEMLYAGIIRNQLQTLLSHGVIVDEKDASKCFCGDFLQ